MCGATILFLFRYFLNLLLLLVAEALLLGACRCERTSCAFEAHACVGACRCERTSCALWSPRPCCWERVDVNVPQARLCLMVAEVLLFGACR